MSYIVYINGKEIEKIDSRQIAYTKQVNDIARLDNRQSNFTHKFIAPPTANNKRAMENVYLVGNQSNIPYQYNRVDVIDSDTGEHLIFKGNALINYSTNKGYEINTYDGIIDFYQKIENKSLTDCNISGLDHVKNLDTIVDSWTENLPYKYILADYNGKKYTTDNKINADYLVPSARYSYLWQKVHDLAGFTYSGNIFNTERFVNWWMTYPKPVPTTEPNVIAISSQVNSIGGNSDIYYFDPLNIGSSITYVPIYFPILVTGTYLSNANNRNVFDVYQSGSYRLKCNGYLQTTSNQITTVDWEVRNSLNEIVTQGVVNAQSNQSVVIQANVGDKIVLGSFFFSIAPIIGGSITSSLDLIDGYSAMFSDAFIDFPCKDFINEVMQELSLTAFKDKYSNNIEYLTLDEILQDINQIDWSSKFTGENYEKNIVGQYAQKNKYQYRYNSENETHNDGVISINNPNLKDEVIILKSKIYSPEKNKTTLAGEEVNVYKLWDKQIKDDTSIDYKELTGRFYSLRYLNITFNDTYELKSEVLNTTVSFTQAPIEKYYRLSLQHIIYDNYSSIESIIDKAKTIEAGFDLKVKDVSNFTFKNLIYIEQLQSYYLVNKISNFVKGKETKCELIEVDYFKKLVVPPPTEIILNLISSSQDGCSITFNLNSNIVQPANVQIVPYILALNGGILDYIPASVPPINAVMNSNTISHTFSELPEMIFGGYKFKIQFLNSAFEWVETELTEAHNISNSCYVSTQLSYITIVDVQTISIIGNVRKVRVTYESDLTSATMSLTLGATGTLPVTPITESKPQNGTIDIDLNNSFYGTILVWQLQLNSGSITSNIAYS